MTSSTTHRRPKQAQRSSAPHEIMTGYLQRLGVEPSAPSVDALTALHRAHVERVPYETFWLHLGEGWGITPHESLRRIVVDRRGGYCFHLNGAFAELLEWLGYHVTRHAAGVHDSNGPSQATIGNHLALTVRGLPDDANPDGRWYVDAGLGDAVHAPLPLVPGTYEQGPSVFAIGAGDGVGDWSFENDAAGSFAGVSVMAPSIAVEVFSARHQYNATSPESSFARTVTAQRRRADGFDIVRGCVLTSRGTTTSTNTFETRADWLEAITDLFGIRLTVPPKTVDGLWTYVSDAHDAWLATAASQLAVTS